MPFLQEDLLAGKPSQTDDGAHWLYIRKEGSLNGFQPKEGKMGGIAGKILGLTKKLLYLALEYATILYYWKLRFFKVQLQKCKKCSALKQMEKAYSTLGSEVYILYKQRETEWAKMPSVQQQLSLVEEAESRVLHVDSMIDEINSYYLSKKQEIKERYAEKRAAVNDGDSEI
jgi:hypothetical protein